MRPSRICEKSRTGSALRVEDVAVAEALRPGREDWEDWGHVRSVTLPAPARFPVDRPNHLRVARSADRPALLGGAAVVEHGGVPVQAEEIEQGPRFALGILDQRLVADDVDLERQRVAAALPEAEDEVVE